jgi:hypothetical protein
MLRGCKEGFTLMIVLCFGHARLVCWLRRSDRGNLSSDSRILSVYLF